MNGFMFLTDKLQNIGGSLISTFCVWSKSRSHTGGDVTKDDSARTRLYISNTTRMKDESGFDIVWIFTKYEIQEVLFMIKSFVGRAYLE